MKAPSSSHLSHAFCLVVKVVVVAVDGVDYLFLYFDTFYPILHAVWNLLYSKYYSVSEKSSYDLII